MLSRRLSRGIIYSKSLGHWSCFGWWVVVTFSFHLSFDSSYMYVCIHTNTHAHTFVLYIVKYKFALAVIKGSL